MNTASTPPRFPAKPRPGDKVAVVSPSSALPGVLPMPYELGLRRLREDFGLVPVEYPTTQKASPPAERAADLNAAFADPTIKAVIASIGGDDQITVLRHLDPEVIADNPKPFFGYSDNTNLLTYLTNLGIVAYHGGSIMCEFGRPGKMHPITAASLEAALFGSGPYDLPESTESRTIDVPWDDPATFDGEPPMEPVDGWRWERNTDRVVEGVSWGGNLEILSWLLMADVAIRPPAAYDGGILFLETSEEMPSGEAVFRILRNLGERDLLGRFAGIVWGRPKTWSLAVRNEPERRRAYAEEQRQAVLAAVEAYNPDALLVLDVDFGHTDPQVVIPLGAPIRVDGPARRITVTY